MTPDASRRDRDELLMPWEQRWDSPRTNPSNVQAHDNAAPSKVLIYGPKGEALVRQEPRPVGFRKP